MAETNGGRRRRRTVVDPARVLRTDHGISDLHRDVLLRVLSRLGARQAVRSCVLSRLWRDLWRDIPCINATCREFEIENGRGNAASKLLFNKFVNRMLMLRNPVPVAEFRLWYNCRFNAELGYDHVLAEVQDDYAESSLWIGHALRCKARSVRVFGWEGRLGVNPGVFTSEHLTSLVFHYVSLNPGFFGQLQTGCKALERLVLRHCTISDFEISSQTLKLLSIGIGCRFELKSDEQVSISAPNLIHLSFFGDDPYDEVPILKNMESLEEAYFRLGEFDINVVLVDDIHQFLLSFSGARKLVFYCGGTELMTGDNLQWFPKFNNLKFLALDYCCLYPNLDGLMGFLHKAPNLEQIRLNLKRDNVDIPETLIGVPGNGLFTRKHLKTVEIICSEHDPAVNIVKEFLLGKGITPGQIHIMH